MHEPARRASGVVAACLVAAFALVALSASPSVAADEFEIAGEVEGLFPGADVTLDARVTNPYSFAIRVVATRATVLDASAGCPASMLEVGESRATVEVPARSSGTVQLPVRLSRSAPDACQGATWPLVFGGMAVGPETSGLPGTNMLDTRRHGLLALIGAALIAGCLLLARRRRRRSLRAAP
jgi:LPXTG-motif cell wall-anchored protein